MKIIDNLFIVHSVTQDAAKARESVRKQAALGASIVCSGHGPVVMETADKFPV